MKYLIAVYYGRMIPSVMDFLTFLFIYYRDKDKVCPIVHLPHPIFIALYKHISQILD